MYFVLFDVLMSCQINQILQFSLSFLIKRSWWRHQMETFSALLAICAGNSLAPGEFPVQRPVTRSFDVFLDLRLNKRLSKQSWGWWFETLPRPLWRDCNVLWQNVREHDILWGDKRMYRNAAIPPGGNNCDYNLDTLSSLPSHWNEAWIALIKS